MNNLNSAPSSPKKIKLDFKDSKYATGRRKRSIKVWIKKVRVIFMLMESKWMNILKDPFTKLL